MRWKARPIISQARLKLGPTFPFASRMGQATVEAAFLIPVLFTVVLMLVQPGIVLYDRMVMKAAASDACRMLATRTYAYGMDDDSFEWIVKRHLGAVPQQELFHVHEGEGGCSWKIVLEGDEASETVQVRICNRIRLLPLIDTTCRLAGAADSQGCIAVEVTERAPVQPAWAAGQAPESWVYQR